MELPTLVFQKNVDKTQNKMIIPKFFVEKWGLNYVMYVNNEKGEITIKPIKKESEN